MKRPDNKSLAAYAEALAKELISGKTFPGPAPTITAIDDRDDPDTSGGEGEDVRINLWSWRALKDAIAEGFCTDDQRRERCQETSFCVHTETRMVSGNEGQSIGARECFRRCQCYVGTFAVKGKEKA